MLADSDQRSSMANSTSLAPPLQRIAGWAEPYTSSWIRCQPLHMHLPQHGGYLGCNREKQLFCVSFGICGWTPFAQGRPQLEDIPERAAIVLLSSVPIHLTVSRPRSHLLASRAILLVELLILPDQERPQAQSKKAIEEHESSTDALPFHIPRLLTCREDPRSQKWSALTDQVEQDDTIDVSGCDIEDRGQRNSPHASATITALIVHHPRQNVGNLGLLEKMYR